MHGPDPRPVCYQDRSPGQTNQAKEMRPRIRVRRLRKDVADRHLTGVYGGLDIAMLRKTHETWEKRRRLMGDALTYATGKCTSSAPIEGWGGRSITATPTPDKIGQASKTASGPFKAVPA